MGQIKPIKDERYRYLMVKLTIRWVDYERLRDIFPAQRDESASSYFTRLAFFLKEYKNGM